MKDLYINKHSSICIKGEAIIYVDPFEIEEAEKADIVFITHDHYDHFDPQSIKKLLKKDTYVVAPAQMQESLSSLSLNEEFICLVNPNHDYEIKNISFKTVPAYNNEKKFHQRNKNYVGYMIRMNDQVYYVVGDSDVIEEMKNIHCDVLLVPIGGTYTMNVEEALQCVSFIHPSIVIPTHYGSIVGDHHLGSEFKEKVEKQFNDIKVEVLIQ